jgi:hypothetical protein
VDDPSDCIACTAGYFASPSGQSSCSECSAGKYSSGTGSAACTSCPSGQFQPFGVGGPNAFVAEHADGIEDCVCNPGDSINTMNVQGGCVACPFPERCLGFNCSHSTTGNLCGSCAHGYYSTGKFCLACADSPWTTVLAAAVGLAVVALLIWKLSKPHPYKPPSTLDMAQELSKTALEISEAADEFRETVATVGRQSMVVVGRDTHTLVASVVWPHFTFSLLPLMLPHVHWPSFVTDAAKWFRSLAFLDIGVFANPECFDAGADSAKKALTRLSLSHGGFWLVLVVFTLVRCVGKCTAQRKVMSQRAVNATVFAFVLAHALLLRSCLGVLHCVPNTANDDASEQASDSSENVGRLQSDPDTACDLRTTWLLVALMVALLCSLLMVRRLQTEGGRSTEGNKPVRLLICAWTPLVIQVGRLLIWPEATLSADEYTLPALGTVGTMIYGFLFPLQLYRIVKTNVDNGRLDNADFRARYGYLISRFKHGKWGSEFRILARKSALLLATTLFAEENFLVVPAQLVTLAWALFKQCKELPFAEVGSKKVAFESDNPTGWSRGDVLETLSLVSQMGINLLSLASGHFVVDTSDPGALVANVSDPVITQTNMSSTDTVPSASLSLSSIAIASAILGFMVMPALYGVHIQWTEWRVGCRNKRRLAPSESHVELGQGLYGADPVERVINPTKQDT